MKKLILAVVVILVFLGYVVYEKKGTDTQTPTGGLSDGTSAPSESVNPTPAPSPTPNTPTPTPTPVSQGTYKNGTYLGDVVDAVFGLMQVKAVIAGGKLTDVQFVKYPYDNVTTKMIQDGAMPRWKANALKIQSANVDIVSGATQSSEGFQKTLASALAKATL